MSELPQTVFLRDATLCFRYFNANPGDASLAYCLPDADQQLHAAHLGPSLSVGRTRGPCSRYAYQGGRGGRSVNLADTGVTNKHYLSKNSSRLHLKGLALNIQSITEVRCSKVAELAVSHWGTRLSEGVMIEVDMGVGEEWENPVESAGTTGRHS